MTFDEELYLLEEEYQDFPGQVKRTRLIQFLQEKIKILSGSDLELAHENIARLYLEQGTDIKESSMNAREARPYFQKVLDSGGSQSLRDAAAYHLGHAALLERDPRAALVWFEKALSSEAIDRGRKIKAYYHAARCAVQAGEYDKGKGYLETGRALDNTRKYQTEYEAAYYVIDVSQTEPVRQPYLISIPGADSSTLTSSEADELLENNSYAILDIRSELHPRILFSHREMSLPERFVPMLISLSRNVVHSDDYWLTHYFEELQLPSLKVIVARQNQRFQKGEIPIKIARKDGKYLWEGPGLGILTTIE